MQLGGVLAVVPGGSGWNGSFPLAGIEGGSSLGGSGGGLLW